MRRNRAENHSPPPWVISLLSVGILTVSVSPAFGWGAYAHRLINRKAIETLPLPLRAFFSDYADYLAEHSVDPDRWRQRDDKEGFHHYLDLDRYGSYPFTALPHSYEAAVAKFGQDTVRSRGLAPWRIAEYLEKLTQDMRKGDIQATVLDAAVLGHYVADIHVPLHATANYDGQLSGNLGVHGRFESWMVETYAQAWKIHVDGAEKMDDPLEYAFDVLLDSYVLADDVLLADTRAKQKGKNYVKREDYDAAYLARFLHRAGPIAERRINDAITALGGYWYTAWVNAGKPKLTVSE